MAVLYMTAVVAIISSFVTGIMDLGRLKKKVNGQFAKAIAPEVSKWKS